MDRKHRARLAIALWIRFAGEVSDEGAAEAAGTSAAAVRLALLEVAELLPEPEREVFAARYCQPDGRPETLASLAERLAISREQVRRIELTAIKKLAPRWQWIADNADAVLVDPN